MRILWYYKQAYDEAIQKSKAHEYLALDLNHSSLVLCSTSLIEEPTGSSVLIEAVYNFKSIENLKKLVSSSLKSSYLKVYVPVLDLDFYVSDFYDSLKAKAVYIQDQGATKSLEEWLSFIDADEGFSLIEADDPSSASSTSKTEAPEIPVGF